MEDLVGVGVADAGEEARVGQRALDDVVLACQRLAEGLRARFERLDPSPIEFLQSRFPARQIQRSSLLRARFREEKSPVLEIESRERGFPADLRAAGLPVRMRSSSRTGLLPDTRRASLDSSGRQVDADRPVEGVDEGARGEVLDALERKGARGAGEFPHRHFR